MLHSSIVAVVISGWGLCVAHNTSASESEVLQAKTELPDSEFLEFLAGMTEVDGETTDALDMIEIQGDEFLLTESSLPNKPTTTDVLEPTSEKEARIKEDKR